MRCYEFGNTEKPTIMLLPGTSCHWKNNFDQVIDLLIKDFFVVCVSYDGFDETETSEFPDMLTEAAKIEEYILSKFNGKVHTVYGCSLGGSFVGLLMQRKRIHMKHGIIGSSDLDQADGWGAKLQTALIGNILYKMLHTGKVPGFLKKALLKKGGADYAEKGLRMMGIGGVHMTFATKRSIKNQFYSDLVTPLEDHIQIPGTTVHCFYAQKMGPEYLKRYHQHFQNPHIVRHDLMHEELLVCRPKEWCETVKKCVL